MKNLTCKYCSSLKQFNISEKPLNMDPLDINTRFIVTHRWIQADTDRNTCPLCPYRWLRSCRAVKHIHSHQSDSEHPGNPAHRSMSSHPRAVDIVPGFGRGLASTGPQLEAVCQEVHLWTDYIESINITSLFFGAYAVQTNKLGVMARTKQSL